ncbi:MAG: CRISPR-associated helicase Cas3' [Oscillospiraceae bacterium]|nr:CRISPR-associated helicase Cas3' [Oscillospiraceae bacterium]
MESTKEFAMEHAMAPAMESTMESTRWNDAYARPGQLLCEHAKNVSVLASLFGGKFGLTELLRISGFLHDFGKVTSEFQKYLERGNEAERGKIHHSIFGAKRAYTETAAFPQVAEIIGNIIASHHGYLYDNISPEGCTPLFEKLAAAKALSVPVEYPAADISKLKTELLTIFDAVPAKEKWFCMSMLTKLAYSCLVDADRLEAWFSESGESYSGEMPDWDALLLALERKLTEFKTHSEMVQPEMVQPEMAQLRKSISDACAQSGLREIGIYKLEAPTGGGKTLSSLRFALEHARIHGMDRIIYIIPYLSILSQTANEIRRVLNADENVVLEHHSNFMPDSTENFKLQTDRWDAPIILSTQIQFLESIFSAKGSDLRKLHNMSRSVIIFDEAQSLPVKCVHLFNGAVNFLHRVCGSTVLLCTATQPLLDTVERPIIFSPNPSIAKCGAAPKLYHIVKALTPGGYAYPQLAEFIMGKHVNSTLIIVNTKSAAKSLYEELKKHGAPALHLSTNMCPAHRDNVIAELRRRLDAKESVICISTQLIEAGVDISLECVIRDIAGLDSVYQAAGRCNRHGEYGEAKNVYVVNIKGQNLDKLPDIKIGAEITQRLFDEGNLDINVYYRYYFHERRRIMDYPTRDGGGCKVGSTNGSKGGIKAGSNAGSINGSIYDLLSDNKRGRGAYIAREDKKGVKPPALLSAIRSAAEEFYVIDRGQTDIVVPYEDAEEIVSKFTEESNIMVRRRLLRALGKYSVSLYKYQIDELSERGALYDREGLTVLARGFYNAERGVDFEGAHEFLYV